MFKLSFVVEDKNLPKVLHALSGLVLNMEAPIPVGNAVIKKGKVVQATDGSNLAEIIAAQLPAHPSQTISSNEIKDLLVKAGGSESAYHYYITKLVERKVLKRKDRGLFTITKLKA